MAPGVTLTYAKLYRKNLEKALDMMCGDADSEKDASDILAEVREKTGKEPALAEDIIFSRSVEDIIAKKYGEEIAKRAVDDVRRYTVEETERATYQAMEALIHNLNTMHSRAGAQIPFSSLNYGMDTSAEGRLVMKSILMATDAGLGNGETPIFPIQIFKVKEGVNYNPGDPNYDLFKLACRVSAKRLFPNFSFVDAPYNLKYYKEGHPETEVAYMGCRTRVMANVYDPTKEITYGRGNLSFTSINLPRIGIRAKGNVDWFFEELDRKIALVIDQLLDRFKIQGEKTVRNYPFLMGQGIWLDSDKLGIDDKVGEVLKHGTLTIGFIGLAECLKALIGKHHGESADAQNLGLEIIGHIRRRADEASRKHGLNFSVIGTPAEGLSGRFVRIDKKKYGIIEGVTDREYYTNSFHIPVYFPISAADKIKLEAPYHELTNGGHITYVELDGDPLGKPRRLRSRNPPHERIRSRLRLNQPPRRPRPRLRLHRHNRQRMPTLPQNRSRRQRQIRTHPPHNRLPRRHPRQLQRRQTRGSQGQSQTLRGFRTRGAVNACKPGGGEDALKSVLPSPGTPPLLP